MAGQPVAASFRCVVLAGRAACGPTGVSGAGGPGRCVCRWAAARPRDVRAVCCCLWLRWCSGRRRARPPARSPHASLRLGVVDLEARPCPPDPPAPSTPVVLCRWRVAGCVGSKPGQAPPPPTGTAVWPSGPSGALHTSGTWCADVCNVGRPLVVRPGSAAAHGHRSLALRSLRLPPHRRRCVAGVWLGACCYKRRQSKVFFVWISDPLLQTSSI